VFAAFDNGDLLAITSSGCAGASELGERTIEGQRECKDPVTNPWKCLKIGSGYCRGQAFLKPGKHLIELKALFSERQSGNGFLRLDTICTKEGILLPCCNLSHNCK